MMNITLTWEQDASDCIYIYICIYNDTDICDTGDLQKRESARIQDLTIRTQYSASETDVSTSQAHC